MSETRNPLEHMNAPQFGIGDTVIYRHRDVMLYANAAGVMRVESMRTDGIDWAYGVLWWTPEGQAGRFEFSERDLMPARLEGVGG